MKKLSVFCVLVATFFTVAGANVANAMLWFTPENPYSTITVQPTTGQAANFFDLGAGTPFMDFSIYNDGLIAETLKLISGSISYFGPADLGQPGQTLSFDLDLSLFQDTTAIQPMQAVYGSLANVWGAVFDSGIRQFVPASVGNFIGISSITLELEGNPMVFSFEGSKTNPLYLATVARNGDPPDPVPEPATMLLFGTGLAGLAGFSRRKK